MGALSAPVRGVFLGTCLILCGSIPPGVAHTDIELQIEALTRQLAREPGNAGLLLKRGDLYRRHVDYDSAALDFAAARRADPNLPLADFYEGRLALETGAFDEARVLLGRYLEAHPDHAAAWVLHGQAELRSHAPGRAEKDFGQAIELSDNPSPDLFRLHILALVANGDVHRALAAVDAGLVQLPGEVNLIGLGTDISLAEGRSADAERYLGRLPRALLRIERWQRRAERASCLAKEGNGGRSRCIAEAREDLQKQIADFSSADLHQ